MIWLISFSFSTSISITFDTVLIFLGIYHWYVSLGFHIVTFTVVYILLHYIWDNEVF